MIPCSVYPALTWEGPIRGLVCDVISVHLLTFSHWVVYRYPYHYIVDVNLKTLVECVTLDMHYSK